MSEKIILFFGELPPNAIHGASISNKINIEILKDKFHVDCIEEVTDLKLHDKISFIKFKLYAKNQIKLLNKLFKTRYDFYYGVIYLSMFGLFKNLLSISFFRLFNYNSKIILHFHRSDFNSKSKNFFFNQLFKLINYFVDKYIVLSDLQAKEMIQYTNKEIVTIYNCIDENTVFKEDCKSSNNKIRILYLSNFIREKGIFDLIESFTFIDKKFKDIFELYCFGSFVNTRDKEKILKMVSNQPNIVINEAISGIKKNKILNSSDLIILPSYNEGIPLILLEAIFLGKAIIISNVGYINEVLGIDYPLFCYPGDVNSISSTIEKAIPFVKNNTFSNTLSALYAPFSFHNHKINLLKVFEI